MRETRFSNPSKTTRTKQRIRKSAVLVFLENGFTKSTVNEIMTHAGLGYGTFYQYYKTKQHVLCEQVKEVLALITTEYKKPDSSEKELFHRTLHSIRNILQTCYFHRDILRILKEAKSTDPELKRLYESIYAELFKRLETDITWSERKGIVRPVKLPVALAALDGMMKGAIDYVLTASISEMEIEQISIDVALLFKEAIFIGDLMPPRSWQNSPGNSI